MFTFAISCLTTSWFTLIHGPNIPGSYAILFSIAEILLSPSDTSTTECHFCFGPTTSFFLKLLVITLWPYPVAHWILSNMEAHLLVSYLYAFLSCSWGSHGKNTRVCCHFLLQWTTFYQNPSLWPIHLGRPCLAWLIASLSYASPFTMARLWSTSSASRNW